MPQLRVRPKAARGLVTEVTPESAGWTCVGFSLHRLEPEDTVAAETGARVSSSSRAKRRFRSTVRILASSANA